jgi:hypothetical protein
MIHLIPVIGPIWASLPLYFFRTNVAIYNTCLEMALGAYKSLSPETQVYVTSLASYWDVPAGLVILVSMQYFFARPATNARWTRIFVTWLCLAITLAAQLYFFNVMLSHQYAHLIRTNPEASIVDFNVQLPLDFTLGYDSASVNEFMDISGDVGRRAYALYLLLDFITIAAYTDLQRRLFMIFPAPESDVFIRQLQTRLPIVTASADVYENMCFLALLFTFPARASDEIIYRAGMATSVKFCLVFVMLGLQISGIIRWLVDEQKPELTGSPRKSKKAKRKKD